MPAEGEAAGALAAELARLGVAMGALTAGCEDGEKFVSAARSLRRASEEIEVLAPSGLASRRLPALGDELEAIRRETGDAVARIVDEVDALLSLDHDDDRDYREAVVIRAMAILEACCVGDITSQRVARADRILKVVEGRVRRFALACGDQPGEEETPEEVAARTALLEGPGAPRDQVAIDAEFAAAH